MGIPDLHTLHSIIKMRAEPIVTILTASVAYAAPRFSVIEAPIPGYGVETLQWHIELAPGRTEVFNGTAQEVLSQVQLASPGFRLREAEASTRLRGGDGGGDGSTHCDGFPEAFVSDILMGMQYLRGLSGLPTNGPGPGNCSRVSCSDSAGIWWCNDNAATKTLRSWDEIADSAGRIYDTCNPSHMDWVMNGQDFNPGNWNTIVRGREDC